MGKRPTVNTDLTENDEITPVFPANNATALAQPAPASAITEVIVALPFDADPVSDYASRHVDCNLDRRQANTLRQLFKGMDTRGERLNNGKRVQNKVDALRRMLEIVEEAKQ